MEPKDLRIGNYYNSVKFNIPVRLELSDLMELYYKCDGAELDSEIISEMINPIVLTEKWLLELGFIKDKGVFKYKLREDLFIRASFHKDILGIVLDDLFEPLDERETVCLNPVKFVHQLQNLYYTLSGHELKLNNL